MAAAGVVPQNRPVVDEPLVQHPIGGHQRRGLQITDQPVITDIRINSHDPPLSLQARILIEAGSGRTRAGGPMDGVVRLRRSLNERGGTVPGRR